jgi:hypothetical protein
MVKKSNISNLLLINKLLEVPELNEEDMPDLE